ncbi:MAG: tetratricopeptide repeat protein [Pyrinomonadaceae bacterium]
MTRIEVSPLLILILMLFLIIAGGCRTQTALTEEASETPEKTVASPADELIKAAAELVKSNPEKAASHVQLASAFLKKVRETGDYSLNRQAEVSIEEALRLEPKNFAAQFLKIQIYLSEHEFARALTLAESLEKDNPDSEALMSAITDAKTELGRYEEAVEAAQKLVDFRPNSNSYIRVAHLRSLHGDIEGAIEARKLALGSADPDDREILAWHRSQLGKEYFNAGRFSEAEREFDLALKIFPDYHWALAGKGKVRAAQNDLETAARIYEELNERTAEIERGIFLGDLYQRLGKKTKAQKIYQQMVDRQREKGGDMHRIALFWADHDINLDEALRIAEKDREENRDLLSSDTLAWCLYKKKDFRSARKYMTEAMRLNTKSALFYYHAGMIENSLGNRREAIRYLKLALSTNPSFDLLQAEVARKTLTGLEESRSGKG